MKTIFVLLTIVCIDSLMCSQKKIENAEVKLQNLKELSLYTQHQWVYTVRIISQLKHILKSGDLLLCPGRSCIHFANIIQFYEDFIIKDVLVKVPAFSKGHYVLGSTRALDHGDHKSIKLKKRALQKKINQLVE